MTERERLIELLKSKSCWYNDCETGCDKCGNVGLCDRDIEIIADYLLANGVIVPQCKVGDVVYVNPETWGGLSFIEYDHCFIHSKHFLVAEVVSIIKTRKQNLIKLKVYNRTTCTYEYKRYSISSIGITVFLTKEEAEKALEG